MVISTNKPLSSKRHQQGLTLIELIVALALGVVLVGGITRVYLENKKNYIQDEELSRLQENGRFVLNILKRELKMEGFMASVQTVPDTDLVTVIDKDCDTNWALSMDNTLDFFNDSTNVTSSVAGDSFSGCITNPGNIQPNTDIISIKRSAGMETVDNGIFSSSGTTTGDMKTNSFYVRLTGGTNPVFEYVGAAFPPASLTPTTNTQMQISYWLYMAKVFYVRNYSVTPNDGIPTLMMISLQDKAMVETPLVEGVERFHIEFGIPTATSEGTPTIFKANPTDDDLSDATVMRVYLLMRTRNAVRGYTDTKTYKLGSMAPVKPGKGYMRRVFTTTIKIRNT